MIQRKQTVYLVLAFTCIVLLLVFPIFSLSAEQAGIVTEGTFGAHGMEGAEGVQTEYPIYLIFISLALFSALGIMSFKNRKRQLVVTRISLILHILLAFSLCLFYYVGGNMLADKLEANGFENIHFDLSTGFFLVVAAIPFIILSIRGIKQDEELLKSIDRIR